MAEPDFSKMSPEEIAEYQRQNCIFCKIIRGEIPSRVVYQDDKVIALLDIYPAGKGHLLMMTKEHYPFLPVVPPDLAKHMFKITKGLSKAAKSAIVTDKATIFIANGGIAGQQSPHFLFHIIPRENGDGLDNFSVPAKDISPAENDKLFQSIKQRLSQLIGQTDQPKNNNTDRSDLAKLILDNPDIKELIIKDPKGFMIEAEKNPELKKLFSGVDIVKLAEALKQTN